MESWAVIIQLVETAFSVKIAADDHTLLRPTGDNWSESPLPRCVPNRTDSHYWCIYDTDQLASSQKNRVIPTGH
jgi:hypothetical protein